MVKPVHQLNVDSVLGQAAKSEEEGGVSSKTILLLTLPATVDDIPFWFKALALEFDGITLIHSPTHRHSLTPSLALALLRKPSCGSHSPTLWHPCSGLAFPRVKTHNNSTVLAVSLMPRTLCRRFAASFDPADPVPSAESAGGCGGCAVPRDGV